MLLQLPPLFLACTRINLKFLGNVHETSDAAYASQPHEIQACVEALKSSFEGRNLPSFLKEYASSETRHGQQTIRQMCTMGHNSHIFYGIFCADAKRKILDGVSNSYYTCISGSPILDTRDTRYEIRNTFFISIPFGPPQDTMGYEKG